MASTFSWAVPTNLRNNAEPVQPSDAATKNYVDTVAGGGIPAGANTELQYNANGAFGGITGVTSDGVGVTVANANIHITGGSAGEVLTTDGAGNLSWSAGGTSGAVVPAIYFTATADGNNQTFSNAYIAAYTSNLDITLFYNGALLDSDFYTLSGDTITITTPINTGDSIDIIRTAIANANAISGYSNVQANAFLAAGLVGDILPDGDAVYSLGGPINQWKDLWVSNSTIYFNTVPLSANNNTLTFAGEPLLISNGSSNITTTGVIETGGLISDGNVVANTGYFFIGDGGLLSNVSAAGGYSNANVASYLPTYTGDLSSVGNIGSTGDINAVGNITAFGNVVAATGAFFVGDGGLLSNISGAGDYSNANVETYLPTYTGNLDSVAAITASGNITANAGAFFIGDGGLLANVGGTGNAAGANTQIQFNDANAFNGSANFTFTNTGPGIVTIGGEMVLTGNGTIATIGSNLLLQPAGNAIIEVAGRQWTYDLSGSLTVPADSVIAPASGNLTLGDVSTITVGSNINLGTTGTITVNTGVGGLINLGTGSGGNVTIGGTAMAGGNVIVGANTLLANGNITSVGNITAQAGAFFIGDGSQLTNLPSGNGVPGGSNTQVQFNDGGAFGGNSNFTFDSANASNGLSVIGSSFTANPGAHILQVQGLGVTLGSAADGGINIAGATTTINSPTTTITSTDVNLGSNTSVHITGGTTGQYLQTDGAGNLLWADAVSTFIPAIYFPVVAAGNNQTFSNSFLASYTSNTEITLFYNGVLLENTYYTLAGDTITINTTLAIGDSIDIIQTAAGNVNVVTGTYANSNVEAYLNSGQMSDIIPAGNSVYSLGNLTNQWKDIWVSNATIYFNSVPLSANNNTLTFAGEPILVSGGDTNITTTGTIETGGMIADGNIVANTGYFFLGDGGLLSNVASSYGNAEVSTYLSSGTDTTGIVTTGNVTANRIAATTFSGDGGLITNITGGYVVGDVANAAYSVLAGSAATVYDNAQPNITSVGTLVNLTSAGNIEVTAGSFFIGDGSLLTNLPVQPGTYSNSNVASYMPTYTGNLGNVTNITLSGTISGNGVGLSDIAGANVTGQVANALVAGTVYTNAQPNITSVGTLTSLDVTGNITLGAGGFFIGDGGLLSNISGGSNYGNGDVAVYLPTYTGNLGNVDSITTTGNITVGTGSFIVGDGTYLTNVPGAVAESPFSIETASFSAVAGARYGVDTTGGAITATLPATPATGQAIFFADAGGAYATNNLTVARNGQTIMGDASDMTVSTPNQNFGLFWNGTTWRTY